MALALDADSEFPSSTIEFTAGPDTFALRYTWRERMGSWYCDLFAADGTLLVSGRRLTPGSSPWGNFLFEGRPAFPVICVGPDNYVREDLGVSLFLVMVDMSEVTP